MINKAIQLTKNVVEFSGKATLGTLSGIQKYLSESMIWSGKQLSSIPLEKEWTQKIKNAGASAIRAGEATRDSFENAIVKTSDFAKTLSQSLDIADDYMYKILFDNVAIGSVTGTSFDDIIPLTKINFSFRMNQKDVGVEEVFQEFKNSGKSRCVLYIQGLFCDEGVWMNSENENGLSEELSQAGFYPLYIRYHPGLPIYENAKYLIELLNTFFHFAPDQKISIVTYSQGGLIFRSALYSLKESESWRKNIEKVVFISSPDGGSYIEKVGFWIGMMLEKLPIYYLKVLGVIGNMRSDAMKDMSHGIIREEDSKQLGQIERYRQEKYFGELDDIDAFQIYSMVSFNESNGFKEWIGDGVVEKPSLTYLTDRVFLKKENPEKRSIRLNNLSHFQILRSPEMMNHLREIFK